MRAGLRVSAEPVEGGGDLPGLGAGQDALAGAAELQPVVPDGIVACAHVEECPDVGLRGGVGDDFGYGGDEQVLDLQAPGEQYPQQDLTEHAAGGS